MATLIRKRTHFIHLPVFGFVPSIWILNWVLVIFGTLLILFFELYTPTVPSVMTTAKSSTNKYFKDQKTRIAEYMVDYNQRHSKHKTLTMATALQLADAIVIESKMLSIPTEIEVALIQQESGFDQYEISESGALGFWQVMPNWHADKVLDMYSKAEIANKNIYDPYTNTAIGSRILKDSINKNKTIKYALACYNGYIHLKDGDYADTIEKSAKIVANQI